MMTAVAGEASQPSPCNPPGKIWLAVVHLGRGSRESGGELSMNILGGNIKQSSHLRQGENLIEHSSQLLKRRNISGIKCLRGPVSSLRPKSPTQPTIGRQDCGHPPANSRHAGEGEGADDECGEGEYGKGGGGERRWCGEGCVRADVVRLDVARKRWWGWRL